MVRNVAGAGSSGMKQTVQPLPFYCTAAVVQSIYDDDIIDKQIEKLVL